MNKFILDISKLRNNVIILRKKYKKQKFCAMVKANAYGHGVIPVSKNIEDLVDMYGVAYICEGVKLRNNNIHKPILIVGAYDKKRIRQAIINDLTITVTSLKEYVHISKIAEALKIKTKIHIKINTGMNRYGIKDLLEFKEILSQLKKQKYILLDGIFTHISKASDKQQTLLQNKKFKKYINGIKNCTIHAASSEVAEKYPHLRYDMVRVGIAMYGYGKDVSSILTIKSNICDIKDVLKGESIGYENTYISYRDMRIGVVAMGYADGVDYRLGNIGYVIIKNKRARIVGRVCMDCFMVDISHIDVKNGDEVVVFSSENNAETWAKKCGTISYDILTGFNFRRLKVCLIK